MISALRIYVIREQPGGADDFFIHVSAADSNALREFIVTLSASPDVAMTQTNLIFEHIRGTV